MRRITLVLLGLLVISAITVAQEASTSQEKSPAKAVTISGTVSNDGKTLVSEQDDAWTVSNADVLKGREGREVTVKCRPDMAKHSIHVFFVKSQEARVVARFDPR